MTHCEALINSDMQSTSKLVHLSTNVCSGKYFGLGAFH